MRIFSILFFSLFLLIAAFLSDVWITESELPDFRQYLVFDRHNAHEEHEPHDDHEDDHDEGHDAHEPHDDHDDDHDEGHDHDAHEPHEEHEDEHDAGHDHEGHEDHEEHHDENKLTRLNDAQMQAFGVEVSQAKSGQLQRYLTLTGEIALNQDNLVHLVPRVEGIVLKVHKNLGESVKKGELMAVLESREVADAKAEYLASKEQLALAQDNYDRSHQLQKKRLISEQQLFEIKQTLLEMQIRNKAAARKLHALGFESDYVKKLPKQAVDQLTKYQMIAPFDGVVVEKHIVVGEVLSPDLTEYVIC